jgi:mono/diheme cytochrome c family protein
MFVMLSSRHRTDREKGRRGDGEKVVSPYLPVSLSPRLLLLLLSAFCLLAPGCRRDMQDQPKAIAYRESTFFKDGVSSRPPVEGTVPRGYLRADREFYFGKKSGTAVGNQQVGSAGSTPANRPQDAGAPNASALSTTAMFPDDVDVFPFPITKEILERGQERYQIFCSSCHGLTGYGDGMVARRGFNKPAPASFHQDKLRQAPVGHFFDVVTNGWGAMPSHASQIPIEDRWKIIAYVRVLQLSQTPAGGNPTVREGASTSPKGPQK